MPAKIQCPLSNTTHQTRIKYTALCSLTSIKTRYNTLLSPSKSYKMHRPLFTTIYKNRIKYIVTTHQIRKKHPAPRLIPHRPLWYEKVYLQLHKVADVPFHITRGRHIKPRFYYWKKCQTLNCVGWKMADLSAFLAFILVVFLSGLSTCYFCHTGLFYIQPILTQDTASYFCKCDIKYVIRSICCFSINHVSLQYNLNHYIAQ